MLSRLQSLGRLAPRHPFRWREPARRADGTAVHDHWPAVRLPWPLGRFVFFRGPGPASDHPATIVPCPRNEDHGHALRSWWRFYRVARAPGEPHAAPTAAEQARMAALVARHERAKARRRAKDQRAARATIGDPSE